MQVLKECVCYGLWEPYYQKLQWAGTKKYTNYDGSHVLNNIKDNISIMLAHNFLKHYGKVPHILHLATKWSKSGQYHILVTSSLVKQPSVPTGLQEGWS